MMKGGESTVESIKGLSLSTASTAGANLAVHFTKRPVSLLTLSPPRNTSHRPKCWDTGEQHDSDSHAFP